MSNWVRAAIAVGLVAVLGAVAVLGIRDAEDRRLQAALNRYDLALAQVTSTFDSAPLKSLASPNQISRVNTYLVFLYGNGKRLDSQLNSIAIRSHERQKDGSYDIVAHEVWTVTEYSLDTGGPLGDPFKIEQDVRYVLTQSGGELIVDLSDVVSEESE